MPVVKRHWARSPPDAYWAGPLTSEVADLVHQAAEFERVATNCLTAPEFTCGRVIVVYLSDDWSPPHGIDLYTGDIVIVRFPAHILLDVGRAYLVVGEGVRTGVVAPMLTRGRLSRAHLRSCLRHPPRPPSELLTAFRHQLGLADDGGAS